MEVHVRISSYVSVDLVLDSQPEGLTAGRTHSRKDSQPEGLTAGRAHSRKSYGVYLSPELGVELVLLLAQRPLHFQLLVIVSYVYICMRDCVCLCVK